MSTLIGLVWFAMWLLVTIIGCVRRVNRGAVRPRQPPSADRTVLEANRQRVAVGAAIFALLCGGALSAVSIQRLLTHPTLLDAALVVIILPVLVISARRLLFAL